MLMLIFLLSLAGVPPTAGFVAKLLIFWSLLETGHPYLALTAALYILPAAYYYFRIVAAMWARQGDNPEALVISATKMGADNGGICYPARRSFSGALPAICEIFDPDFVWPVSTRTMYE